jgi:hypothetical protein
MVLEVELFSTLLYVTFHLYPLGRPDSVNVVVHVVEPLNDMDCVEPAVNVPEEGDGVYVVVHAPVELLSVFMLYA